MDRQPNNPLHGITLAAMLDYLVVNLGWPSMARAVDIRCFVSVRAPETPPADG